MHSFIRPFVRFVHSFVRSFALFIHSFVRSFVHSFIHSCAHSSAHSSAHSLYLDDWLESWVRLLRLTADRIGSVKETGNQPNLQPACNCTQQLVRRKLLPTQGKLYLVIYKGWLSPHSGSWLNHFLILIQPLWFHKWVRVDYRVQNPPGKQG